MLCDDLSLGQIKERIVRPTLAALGLDSDAAINLVTGTGLVESQYRYVRQMGGGPALGYWQMEPATHDDCWQNFLRFPRQSRLATAIRQMLARDLSPLDQLITNTRYACAMARIKYARAHDSLPDAQDAAGLSAYHKRIYNTALGAASAASNVAAFQRVIRA